MSSKTYSFRLSPLTTIVSAAAASTTPSPPPAATIQYNKTVCILPLESRIERGAHAFHTVNYYKQQFLPQINFTPVYIMPNEATVKNFVTTWVTRGREDCDVVIGAGFSFLAIAMSPLVDIPWVGTTETSVELSDKANHPTFSRVIPTDEVGAQAADILYQEYGWNTSNIFCSDESYGRSVAAGLFDVLTRRGGEVDINRCLETTATEDRVEIVVDSLLQSSTRVVFVAMLPSSTLFTSFKNILMNRQATNNLILVFSEAFCLASSPAYLDLPGSLCATYLADPAIMNPFFESYSTRDTLSTELDTLESLGFPRTVNINGTTSVSGAFAHDATLHAMNSVFHHNTTTTSSNNSSVFSVIRSFRTTGATGSIQLAANGDRASIDVAIYNSDNQRQNNLVATIKSQQFNYTTTPRPDLYLLGRSLGPNDAVPPSVPDPSEIRRSVVILREISDQPLSNTSQFAQLPVIAIRDDTTNSLLVTIPQGTVIKAEWIVTYPPELAEQVTGESYDLIGNGSSSVFDWSSNPIQLRDFAHGSRYKLRFTIPSAIESVITPANSSTEVTPAFCADLDSYTVIGSSRCEPCPDNMLCNGTATMLVSAPYWRPNNRSVTAYSCEPPFMRSSCQSFTETGTCEEGHTGPRCSLCEEGYGYGQGSCSKCGNIAGPGMLWFILVLFIIAVLVGISILVGFTMKCKKKDTFPMFLKISTGHFAISSTILSFFEHLPRSMLDLMEAQKAVSRPDPRTAFFSCATGATWYHMFIVINVAPLILCFVVGTVITAWRKRARKEEKAHLEASRLRSLEASKLKSLEASRLEKQDSNNDNSTPMTGGKIVEEVFTVVTIAVPEGHPNNNNSSSNTLSSKSSSDNSQKNSLTTNGGTTPAALAPALQDEEDGEEMTAFQQAAGEGTENPLVITSSPGRVDDDNNNGHDILDDSAEDDTLFTKVDPAAARRRASTAKSTNSVSVGASSSFSAAMQNQQHEDGDGIDHIDLSLHPETNGSLSPAEAGELLEIASPAPDTSPIATQIAAGGIEKLEYSARIEKFDEAAENENIAKQDARQIFAVSAIVILFLVYPTLVETCISVLKCDTIDESYINDDGTISGETAVSYFFYDRSTLCSDRYHQSFVVAGVLFGLLWGVGIPSAAMYMYRRLRKPEELGGLGKATASKLFSFFLAGYRKQVWWWEILNMYKKFAMIFILQFVPTSSLQTLAACWVLSCYLVTHSVIVPFENKAADRLERLSVITLTITLNLGLFLDLLFFLELLNREAVFADFLRWSVVVLNIGVSAVILVVLVHEFVQMTRRNIYDSRKKLLEKYPQHEKWILYLELRPQVRYVYDKRGKAIPASALSEEERDLLGIELYEEEPGDWSDEENDMDDMAELEKLHNQQQQGEQHDHGGVKGKSKDTTNKNGASKEHDQEGDSAFNLDDLVTYDPIALQNVGDVAAMAAIAEQTKVLEKAEDDIKHLTADLAQKSLEVEIITSKVDAYQKYVRNREIGELEFVQEYVDSFIPKPKNRELRHRGYEQKRKALQHSIALSLALEDADRDLSQRAELLPEVNREENLKRRDEEIDKALKSGNFASSCQRFGASGVSDYKSNNKSNSSSTNNGDGSNDGGKKGMSRKSSLPSVTLPEDAVVEIPDTPPKIFAEASAEALAFNSEIEIQTDPMPEIPPVILLEPRTETEEEEEADTATTHSSIWVAKFAAEQKRLEVKKEEIRRKSNSSGGWK